MAGRLSNCRYCRFLLVVMTLALSGTILATAGVWNPVPQIAAWWDRITRISDPNPAWKVRLGGSPDMTAVLPDKMIIAASYGTVAGYRQDGQLVWSYPAYWALPAGDVVVMRSKPTNRNQTNDKGYTVIEPTTGATLWSDQKSTAVWAFTDQIVELECPEAGDCQLRGRQHQGQGAVVWKATLPATARSLKGPAPGLVGLRDPAGWFDAAAKGIAVPTPAVFGLRVGATIQIIETKPPGQRIREVATTDQQTRMTFAGQRVLVSHSETANSGCRYTLEGRFYATDTSTWTTSGLDLGTGSGTVCEQREDPKGAGDRILATDKDDHPVLVNATDGRVSWTGVPGEEILATDGDIAVVLGADRKTVRVVDLVAPHATPSFSAPFGLEPQAAITRDYVVIRDRDAGRIVVLNHYASIDGKLPVIKEIKTGATVCAIGLSGLLLSNGRTIGYLALAG